MSLKFSLNYAFQKCMGKNEKKTLWVLRVTGLFFNIDLFFQISVGWYWSSVAKSNITGALDQNRASKARRRNSLLFLLLFICIRHYLICIAAASVICMRDAGHAIASSASCNFSSTVYAALTQTCCMEESFPVLSFFLPIIDKISPDGWRKDAKKESKNITLKNKHTSALLLAPVSCICRQYL